jgi:hypothetical protein
LIGGASSNTHPQYPPPQKK